MSTVPAIASSPTPQARDVPPTAAPHLGTSVARIVATQFVGAMFPLAAGLLLYGWRAAGAVATVAFTAGLAAAVWRRVGRRGAAIDVPCAMFAGMLLALLLPAHLFSTQTTERGAAVWAILPAAGVTLVMLMWLLGGSGRIHPVLLTALILVVLFQSPLVPQTVLQRTRLLIGDVLHAVDAPSTFASQPWIDAPSILNHDAIRRQSVAQQLTLYTLGLEQPDRAWLSLQSLIRDRLPPLEDLIVGGQPGVIGCSSAVAVVVGGLFLLYRGLIDYRIPLLIVLGAWAALLILPVPIVITEQGPEWRWLAWRESAATWAVAITFANYEVLASPLLFAAFFLATPASIRPMSRRMRAVYALFIGVVAAALQLYVSASTGPLVAVLAGGLLSALLDRIWRGRPTLPAGLIVRST